MCKIAPPRLPDWLPTNRQFETDAGPARTKLIAPPSVSAKFCVKIEFVITIVVRFTNDMSAPPCPLEFLSKVQETIIAMPSFAPA